MWFLHIQLPADNSYVIFVSFFSLGHADVSTTAEGRLAIVNLMQTLLDISDKSMCSVSHVPVLLAAYTATMTAFNTALIEVLIVISRKYIHIYDLHKSIQAGTLILLLSNFCLRISSIVMKQ